MSAVVKDDLFATSMKRADVLRFKDSSYMHSEVEKARLPGSIFGALVLLMLISGCLWFGYYLSKPETLPIKQVKILGEFRHLSPSRLQSLVTDSVSGGFFNVNVTTVRNELLKAAWVEDVAVNRIWPDTLKVEVIERVAVARWGDDALLNSEAEHFMPPAATIPYDLPLLLGPEGSHASVLARFNELNKLLSKVGLYVVKLELNDRRAWSFEVQRGFTVIVGRSDYGQRVKRFVDVVAHAMSNRIDEINEIDMRYTNGFAVRWKNADTARQLEQ